MGRGRRIKPKKTSGIKEDKEAIKAFEAKLSVEQSNIDKKIANGELKPPKSKRKKASPKKKRPRNKATRPNKSQEEINADVLKTKPRKRNRETVATANPVKPINDGPIEPALKRLEKEEAWDYNKPDWENT